MVLSNALYIMSNKIEFILNKNKQYLECELTHTCITLHIMFILKENIYVIYHYILFSLFLLNEAYLL